MRVFILLFLFFLAAVLVAASFFPALDLYVAGLFFDSAYQPLNPANHGFYWRELAIPNALHETIQWGARAGAAALAILIIINRWRKACLFLLISLLIGPGLLTNTVLKDNWGRARPVQIQEFGGTASFTPALQPADQCQKNCSFISGDGALGFYLHSLFYVVPPAWRRRTFALGFIGGGVIFGGLRIAMGAHFLSDVLWGGLLMLLCSAIIHALFYGRMNTINMWKSLWFKPADQY